MARHMCPAQMEPGRIYRERQSAGREPDNSSSRDRGGGDRRHQGRLDPVNSGGRRGEVAELKDNINTMISNLRETTERNNSRTG